VLPAEPTPVAEPAPLETEATAPVDVVEATDPAASGGVEDEGVEIDPHSTTGLNGAAPSGTKAGAPAGGGTVVVTVGGDSAPEAAPALPPAESTPPPSNPPAESAPPAEPPAPSGASGEDRDAEADPAAPTP